jgi:hypothetical protein
MYTEKSPGGSIYPYFYKGGQLFGWHYGSFFADEERLLALMKAEEAFLARPKHQTPAWADFYETNLTDRVLDEFVAGLQRLGRQITKLGIVGCSFKDRWRLGRRLKKTGLQTRLPVRFFDDPEDAKTWLVSEKA